MAPKPQKPKSSTPSNKRKVAPEPKFDVSKPNPKKFKSSTTTSLSKNAPKNSFASAKHDQKKPWQKEKQFETKKVAVRDEFESKKESRIRAKELAEARKKKRKKHYTLEQELSLLWEKMRRRNIAKDERSKLVSEALQKMKGKTTEIAGSHVSSRVLQTCVKYCSTEERTVVFQELQPHFITLASNTYAVHLVTKLLDNATKEQLAEVISSLHGHVASLLRHMVGSVVIEHAYNLANATQKQALLMELYSPELQLFKDLVSINESRLVDVISKLKLKKTSVLRHMSSVLQPVLEKGIIDHSITHKALMEYLSIAGPTSALEVIQPLSGPILVRVIHTKDGSKIGALCVKHGSAKERKKIIKGMKSFVNKTACDKYGTMVLACIFSVVDDTKLVSKVIINELLPVLKEAVFDQSARRPLLQLLQPYSQRYFTSEDLTTLNITIPSLCNKTEASETDKVDEEIEKDIDEIIEEITLGDEGSENPSQNVVVNEGGKKDPFTRRKELLIDSGLAEKLIEVCCEMPEELLKSKFGKDVIYEVATGGADGILLTSLDEKLKTLYESIASSVVAEPKVGGSEDHLLEQFHSSRTLRKLVLDCPTFALTLWTNALQGKCATWAQGHGGKVISAFADTSDQKVRELAKKELQPLIDSGALKLTPADSKTDKEV